MACAFHSNLRFGEASAIYLMTSAAPQHQRNLSERGYQSAKPVLTAPFWRQVSGAMNETTRFAVKLCASRGNARAVGEHIHTFIRR